MKKKQLKFDEFENLGAVCKVISEALLGLYIEISNQDGRSRNANLLRSIDKCHSKLYHAKGMIEERFRHASIKTPAEKSKNRTIFHGPVVNKDLAAFVDFMTRQMNQRR